ncbi:DoxX family protein [Jeotgalibacillus sp. JSM ZJ347]|uniref:DoxX family protein n=1 Tax=Jeotgalibacillus sp. JSM ZJ347 TaxID=3342117 RepID=UPI0035A97D8F
MEMPEYYWVMISLISGMLLLSAWTYLFSPITIEGIRELRIPDYIRIQLAVSKVIAAVILLIPIAPDLLRHWAFAGAGYFFITSIVAHIVNRDTIVYTMINVIFLGLVAAAQIIFYNINL